MTGDIFNIFLCHKYTGRGFLSSSFDDSVMLVNSTSENETFRKLCREYI